MASVLTLHCAATLFLTGLIWFVQVVHYPLFARVGRETFPEYEAQHGRLTARVVAPPMLIELATGLWLVASPPVGIERAVTWAGLSLIAVIWVSTFAMQVPTHRRLASGFDSNAHRRLVTSNWVRTIAWTFRAAGVFYVFLGQAGAAR